MCTYASPERRVSQKGTVIPLDGAGGIRRPGMDMSAPEPDSKSGGKSGSCRHPPEITDPRYSLFVINSQRKLASSIGWKPSTFAEYARVMLKWKGMSEPPSSYNCR